MTSLKEFLQGNWIFNRQVMDLMNRTTAQMRGNVFLEEHPQGLWYREEGQLDLRGYKGLFYQVYLYRFPAPYKAEVCFSDGRLFYELDSRQKTCEVEHYCGQDHYQGLINFEDHQRMRIEWSVQGPRKNGKIVSELHKTNKHQA